MENVEFRIWNFPWERSDVKHILRPYLIVFTWKRIKLLGIVLHGTTSHRKQNLERRWVLNSTEKGKLGSKNCTINLPWKINAIKS